MLLLYPPSVPVYILRTDYWVSRSHVWSPLLHSFPKTSITHGTKVRNGFRLFVFINSLLILPQSLYRLSTLFPFQLSLLRVGAYPAFFSVRCCNRCGPHYFSAFLYQLVLCVCVCVCVIYSCQCASTHRKYHTRLSGESMRVAVRPQNIVRTRFVVISR